MDIAAGMTQAIVSVALATWWIVVPLLLFFVLKETWLVYARDRYIKDMTWTMLEIKVPKEILTTPKAMEQVFASMYASYSHGISFLYAYLDGFVDDWYSFEMVGHAGGIHFYIYAPSNRRNMVEAAIYARYPDAEIHEVEDYVSLLPEKMPNETYDLWGTDLVLKRESAYPIRTYLEFEDSVEERRLDPVSAIAEVMSGLKDDEMIWMQVVVCPSDASERVGNRWKEEGEEIISKITGREEKKSKGVFAGLFSGLGEWMRNLIWAPIEHPIWASETKEERAATLKFLNPSEQEVVKAIDRTIAKLGFETNFRFFYIGKRQSFTNAHAIAVMGANRQYNTNNLNELRPGAGLTLVSGWKPRFIPFYKKWMLFSLKKKLYESYKARRLGSRRVGKYRPAGGKLMTMNIEELATIYHFPITAVKAPKLRRLETRKGEAPSGLPIE